MGIQAEWNGPYKLIYFPVQWFTCNGQNCYFYNSSVSHVVHVLIQKSMFLHPFLLACQSQSDNSFGLENRRLRFKVRLWVTFLDKRLSTTTWRSKGEWLFPELPFVSTWKCWYCPPTSSIFIETMFILKINVYIFYQWLNLNTKSKEQYHACECKLKHFVFGSIKLN